MGYKMALHLAISEGYVHTCRISKTQQFYISTVHTTHVCTYIHTYTELSTHQSCWQHERKGPSRTIHTCTYVRTYVPSSISPSVGWMIPCLMSSSLSRLRDNLRSRSTVEGTRARVTCSGQLCTYIYIYVRTYTHTHFIATTIKKCYYSI